jgi:hypothetical protein
MNKGCSVTVPTTKHHIQLAENNTLNELKFSNNAGI